MGLPELVRIPHEDGEEGIVCLCSLEWSASEYHNEKNDAESVEVCLDPTVLITIVKLWTPIRFRADTPLHENTISILPYEWS
jgi:hypothetical protein